MPDDAPHIKAARPVAARVVHVRAQQPVEPVPDKVADRRREQARADEEDERGHGDEERAERRARGERVDEEPADEAAQETADGGDRDGGRGLAERDAADEDDGLHALQSGIDEYEDRGGEMGRQRKQTSRRTVMSGRPNRTKRPALPPLAPS
jgi:hypothetical protein